MEINKVCAQYCIDVIRAVMQNRPVSPFPEEVSLQELFAFSKLHGVEAMVYRGLCQLDMEETDPVWHSWETRAAMLMTQSIVQLAERDALLDVLPKAGILILPVKGCWLKEQYPEIDYRQMSDLDILIHPEDSSKARAVMEAQGYCFVEESGEHHDSYAKPPYMGVELHLSLLPETDERHSYYETVWERAVPMKEAPGVFRLKPEDEYIYYLLHLYKHVLYAGTGIRSFLDSVVYRTAWPEMDREYLQNELKKLGLAGFAECVEILSNCWFLTGEAVPEKLYSMAENVLSAGTYGTEERIFQNELQRVRTRIHNPVLMKMVYLLSCLFLPLKAMRELYPVLEKWPVLLPVFWVWRLISRCLCKPKALLELMKQTNKEGDKIWSEFNWREFQSK